MRVVVEQRMFSTMHRDTGLLCQSRLSRGDR